MPRRKCWVDACSDGSERLGMCTEHADRWDLLVRVHRKTKLYNKTDSERFEFYTNKAPSLEIQKEFGARPDCWVWTGALNHHGYGLFSSNIQKELGIGQQVHLFTLNEYAKINTRDDLHTDHSCRFRPCSNVEHLVRMTRKDNILLGLGFSAVNSRKDVCDSGHEFTPKNTAIDANGWRSCRECSRMRNREYTSRPEAKKARLDKREPPTGVRGMGQYLAQREKCPEGHLLAGDNLLIEKVKKSGSVSDIRRCRTCTRERHRKEYAARQGDELAPGVKKSDCVTRNQAAEMAGLAPTYMSTFTKRNPGFPEPVRSGRPAYYLRSDIEKWIQDNAEAIARVKK